MPKSHYDWKNGPTELKQHSVAKHQLLQCYLAEYFPTLISSHNQEELKLTIVDGFAGGGSYIHADSGQVHDGSPFICLKAAEEAEFRINADRTKKVKFNVDYFFVEKDKNAANYLKTMMNERQYGSRVGQDVHLLEGDFLEQADGIIAHIQKKSPRSGRSIFILDQYGYTDVPMPLLEKIFQTLPKAEIILTFGVDSFSKYASDKSGKSPLESIGLPNIFEGQSLSSLKANKNWLAHIQSQLHPYIVRASGAKFHTTFFIRSTKGHGDFWLIHLSMHPKARDVMTEVHWANGNSFIHYGGDGLDMYKIGYVVGADERFTKQGVLGYTFDDDARTRTVKQLHEDIPRLIYSDDDGLSFETFFATTCNESPATAKTYKEVIANLAKAHEVEIVLPDGRTTTAISQIKNDSRIIPPRQRKIVF